MAAFTQDVTVGNNPLDVQFTDESTGAPTAWAWDFGDGGAATEASPSHTFTADGIYTVTLIVSSACGADTLSMTDLITVDATSGVGDGLPRTFALNGNYPNPFNPSTTIEFTLAGEGRVVLEIFDTTGRRQATLVDESMGAGVHTIQWQPRGLPSGVFFARLTAGGKTATRRMVLLK